MAESRRAYNRRRRNLASPDVEPVRAELADVEARIRRLTEAIQMGGALAPLVADLKALTSRREHLVGRLNGERRVGVADLRALEAELRGYLAEWVEMLHRNPQQSRQMLRKLIDGRIIVHPREESAELEFRCSLGKLIAGLDVPKAMVTPAGFEPAISTSEGLGNAFSDTDFRRNCHVVLPLTASHCAAAFLQP
jgi:RecC C-terminal domain